jgi:hypothetical protein
MGQWEKRRLRWYETSILNCQLCGKMIPADLWVSEANGERLEFCSPECERLYWKHMKGEQPPKGMEGTSA